MPDYKVVLVSEEAFDEERTAKLESMLGDLSSGEIWLFLLSDQSLGDFPGAATCYGGQDFFLELPEDIQGGSHANRANLTSSPFLTKLALEDIPFYGSVLDSGDGEEESFAIEILGRILDCG